TVSNGTLTASTIFHVNVAASPVAFRVNGDFNGDHIQDTAFFNQDGSWWFSLNQADGSFVNQNWAIWSAASNWSQVNVGDFNGDGKADFYGLNNNDTWQVAYSASTGFSNQLWTSATSPASAK